MTFTLWRRVIVAMCDEQTISLKLRVLGPAEAASAKDLATRHKDTIRRATSMTLLTLVSQFVEHECKKGPQKSVCA